MTYILRGNYGLKLRRGFSIQSGWSQSLLVPVASLILSEVSVVICLCKWAVSLLVFLRCGGNIGEKNIFGLRKKRKSYLFQEVKTFDLVLQSVFNKRSTPEAKHSAFNAFVLLCVHVWGASTTVHSCGGPLSVLFPPNPPTPHPPTSPLPDPPPTL